MGLWTIFRRVIGRHPKPPTKPSSALAPPGELTVQFTEDGVSFTDYPFPPASVYPSATLAYDAIKEINLRSAPPEIRTKQGEVLFISAVMKDGLKAAAEAHNMPLVARVDVWSLILEPYLDTTFDEKHQEETLQELEANDIGRQLCQQLRDRFGDAMRTYNFRNMIWDWCHFGLMDLLEALQGWGLTGKEFRLPPDQFEEFYHQAMQIAERAQINSWQPPPTS